MSDYKPDEFLTAGERVARENERKQEYSKQCLSLSELEAQGYTVSKGPAEPAATTFANAKEEAYWEWHESHQRQPEHFSQDDPDPEKRGKSFLRWRQEQKDKQIDYDMLIGQIGYGPNASASEIEVVMKRKALEQARAEAKARLEKAGVSEADIALVSNKKHTVFL